MRIYRLPNGNRVVWFGDNEGLDNALILSGGEILFLKTVHKINLNNEEAQNDLVSLKSREFIEKYYPKGSVPFDSEFFWYLRRKIKKKQIPDWESKEKLKNKIKESTEKYIDKLVNEILLMLEEY